MRQIFFIAILFLTIIHLQAQEAAAEATDGWPVVERCVGEPVEPPSDWTFEGTILATGWAGLHGINSDVDTPYVIQFGLYQDILTPFSFSPDKRWIAQIEMSSASNFTMTGRRVRIGDTYVYSTENRQHYALGSEDEVFTVSLFEVEYIVPYVPWWDSDTVVIGRNEDGLIGWDFQTNTKEIIPFDVHINLLSDSMTISPDWTRAVSLDNDWTGLALFDLINDTALLSYEDRTVPILGRVTWLPDSSAYLIPYYETGDLRTQLHMYYRDGDSFETIASAVGHERRPHLVINLSIDGQALAFHYSGVDERVETLNPTIHIANLDTHEVIDTCLNYDSYAWSPDSTQLAVIENGDDQRQILIFDVETWQLYKTGIYHDGNIIAWRED